MQVFYEAKIIKYFSSSYFNIFLHGIMNISSYSRIDCPHQSIIIFTIQVKICLNFYSYSKVIMTLIDYDRNSQDCFFRIPTESAKCTLHISFPKSQQKYKKDRLLLRKCQGQQICRFLKMHHNSIKLHLSTKVLKYVHKSNKFNFLTNMG